MDLNDKEWFFHSLEKNFNAVCLIDPDPVR